MQAFVIATDVFRPLITAQAAARKVEPHLMVVKHPVGGLNAGELQGRIDQAFACVEALMA